MSQKWVKHTINLLYGSDLDMKFKISPNKSHMVRHVFQRANELRMEVLNLIDENQQMKENIAKLQARLSDCAFCSAPLVETNEIESDLRTINESENENERWMREQKEALE